MKKTLISISIISFVFCLSQDVSAQSRREKKKPNGNQTNTEVNRTGNGVGMGRGSENGATNNNSGNSQCSNRGDTRGLKILSKPAAVYTDDARKNNVQGTVILRVTFNADGTIGSVMPIKGLPYGMTEQAIAAAKRIKFEPAIRCGVAITVSKSVEYSFVTK